MNEELYKIALYTIDRKNLHKNERIFIRSCIKTLYEENQQLEEKEELHLNRIDELTDRVVKLETNIEEVIEILNQPMLSYASCVKALDEIEEILKGSDK